MSRRTLTVVLALAAGGPLTSLAAQPPNEVSQRDRVLTATKIYHQIATFFPDLQPAQFDQDFGAYLTRILSASDDRRSFDLESMALVASLHDGHSFFYDTWLDDNYGQPVGFTAYTLNGQWVVVRSALASIHVGDVIERIDSTPTQQMFEQARKYISASSDRDASTSFFDTPALLPERFAVTLDGGRQVVIDRRRDTKREQPSDTEGRWLVPQSVAYIRVPTFREIEPQAAALAYLKQFHDAKAIILDVRGNPGGDPTALQRGMMEQPYPGWSTSTALHGGFLLREYDLFYPEVAHVTTSQVTAMWPRPARFTGSLFVLIDRGCTCACEDFVMPFKVTGRAQLIGETTAGTFSFTKFTRFDNGMMLNIASIRHTFPDGSRFEGVGIVPGVEVQPTVQDLKAGRDVVLDRALKLAAGS